MKTHGLSACWALVASIGLFVAVETARAEAPSLAEPRTADEPSPENKNKTLPSKIVRYHGIRPTDPGGRQGLRNPERGWRTEALIAELPGKAFYPGPAYLRNLIAPDKPGDPWVEDARRFEPFGLTLVQAYCYLTDYGDRPIAQEQLDRLQAELDRMRKAGLKAVLRFAYEKSNDGVKYGPKLEWILRHMDQLEPIVRKNADVIYVLQAGFIGAWGEWHNATHIKHNDHAAQAAVVQRLLKMLPDDRMTQVRVPRYKRQVLQQPAWNAFEQLTAAKAHTAIPAARIGFHNDGFLAGPSDGGTWPEEPIYGKPGNPEFDYMTRESPYVAVDGELFWDDQAWDGVEKTKKGVDGWNAAVRMRLHHYSSFSLAHSYSWREGRSLSIDRWQTNPLTAQEVRDAKMPLSDGYFEDADGRPVARTPFEYVQDHLGYRLELQQAKFTEKTAPGAGFSVEIELINRGFSTLHNPRPVFITLTDASGRVTPLPAKSDPRTWQPFRPGDSQFAPLTHRVAIQHSLPATIAPGWYAIGLWLPDAYETIRRDPRYAVRVANRDVLWWTDAEGRYGINVLGFVHIAAQ